MKTEDEIEDLANKISPKELLLILDNDIKSQTIYNKAKYLQNIGLFLHTKDYNHHSEKILLSTINYYQQINNTIGISICYGNLGLVYQDLGQYQKAEEIFIFCLELSKDNLVYTLKTKINLANFYLVISKYDTARDIFKEVLRKKVDDEGRFTCYSGLGIIYRKKSDYRNARESFKKSLEIIKKIKNKKLKKKLMSVYLNNLGLVYFTQKKFDRALKFFNKIEKGYLEILTKFEKDLVFHNLGVIYYHLKNFKPSIEYLEKSLSYSNQIDDKLGNLYNFYYLGLAYSQDSRNLQKAYENLKFAIDQIEHTGININEPIEYYNHFSHIYDYIIQICIKLNKKEEAFNYVERSKSKNLRKVLAHSNININQDDAYLKSILEEENSLIEELKETLLLDLTHLENSTKGIVKYNKIEEINSKLNRVYERINNFDSVYVSLRKGKIVDISKLQELLREDMVLIEYFLSFEELFIFVISNNCIHIETIKINEKEIKSYLSNYDIEVINYSDDKLLKKHWLNLGKILINPLSEKIKEKKIIYFIPHQFLHYFPLHALELDGYPLINTFKIAYSPSASLLYLFINRQNKKIDSCMTVGIYEENTNFSFHKEAKEVANIFNSENIFIDRPKEQILKNLNYDILHIASHGKFNKSEPMRSYVLLNQNENLTVQEIFSLKSKAKLVTLSCCETGLGVYNLGDEILGLTTALIYSGVSSIIVSLWAVDDLSTYELMCKFYRNLKKGMNKAEALQKSQNDIKKYSHYSNPHYWAPFILIGNWE